MPTVAVVYHSGFGATKLVAEHVVKGAASTADVQAALIPVADLPPPGADRKLAGRWEELNRADAIVFGCPTYMGSASAEFKKFMESSAGLWFTQAWKDKIAAGFTNSAGLSGDKLNTITDLAVFAGQHSMIWASLGTFYQGVEKTDPKTINRLGGWMGLLTQTDQGATPPASDLATAEAFGKRIAQVTARWTRSR